MQPSNEEAGACLAAQIAARIVGVIVDQRAPGRIHCQGGRDGDGVTRPLCDVDGYVHILTDHVLWECIPDVHVHCVGIVIVAHHDCVRDRIARFGRDVRYLHGLADAQDYLTRLFNEAGWLWASMISSSFIRIIISDQLRVLMAARIALLRLANVSLEIMSR